MTIAGKLFCGIAAVCLLTSGTAAAESAASEVQGQGKEEQGLSEIQPLIKISDVTETEGMSLEEVTEAATNAVMSEYIDGGTGFIMQYPSVFQFDEEQDTLTARTEDGKAVMIIENMENNGGLTRDALLEAFRQIPDSDLRTNEQNGCIRIDRIAEDGENYQTDLYFLTEKSFHHITLIYPPEEQEVYHAYIEYMINSMGTDATDQG